ncbi:DUF2283 domain-containing protein [Candidatus Saganbacteria bacterium]|nr:DUF2283 domain-containing protein [Candidatus Saganbacteria bacterium]
MKKPKVHFDLDSDVLYIVTKKGPEEGFVEVAEGVNVELDKNKKVVGIEILNASRFLNPFIKKLHLRRV